MVSNGGRLWRSRSDRRLTERCEDEGMEDWTSERDGYSHMRSTDIATKREEVMCAY